MTILTLFLVLNPAAVAAIWLGYRDQGRRGALMDVLVVTAAASALLAAAVLLGEPVLDALDISDATFLIAAGTVVVFGALQAFLGFGLHHNLESRNWLIVASLVWLASPPAIFAAVAVTLNDGIATGLIVSIAATTVAVVGGGFWARQMGDRYEIVVGLVRRVIAAGAAFGGVDLIRQGVLSI